MSVLRRRFRLALGRTAEKDRIEYPDVWQLLLCEGGGEEAWREDSRDLLGRVHLLVVRVGLDTLLPMLDEVKQIYDWLATRPEAEDPIDEVVWGDIKTKLDYGYKKLDDLYWTVALGGPALPALDSY